MFDPPEDNPIQKFSKSVVPMGKKVKDQTFGFDRIFDDSATQADVYEATTKPLIDNVLDGYNATVFAYGATGCGKTHTISGTPQQPGIIFMTMQELFERVTELSTDKVTEISLSYLEIYNETIRDLLSASPTPRGGLMLREDSNQAVSVAGLTSHTPKNVEEVMDMIVRGNQLRTMSPTEANATSSRSHAVLQINVASKDRNASVEEPHTMATLSIIDLAGSERASATKNRGERLLEGANINKSLLALGSCINALCDPRKRNHVPYRNSKLTRLLKFSLGGNCKTVMIVCVSPSSEHFDETQNTLRYANRAKNIQTKVTRNVYNVNRHVKDFLVKIDEQMAMINELKAQAKEHEKNAFAKFKKQSERKEIVARDGIVRIRAAYEHSSAERQDRTTNMVKLRQIGRRIALLSSWIAAFDTVCDALEDEEWLQNLQAVRQTAQGVSIELESSRHHCQQRLNKNNWERGLNSALDFGLTQLKEVDTGDTLDAATLSREVELLKANAEREALTAVAEHDKGGDAVMAQVLIQAHFETIAAINSMSRMSVDEAVERATDILHKMLSKATSAVSHVVKPDGSLTPAEAFAPRKTGTPKRRKQVLSPIADSPVQLMQNLRSLPQLAGTPVRASPRKRGLLGSAKKGVQLNFTPKKRRSPVKSSKRGVRWRDENENGLLADYESTPKRFTPSPVKDDSTTELPDVPQISELSSFERSMQEQSSPVSSPIPAVPGAESHLAATKDRFKAGYLSRKTDGSPDLSTVVSAPSMTVLSSSDSEQSPLRDVSNGSTKRNSLPSSILIEGQEITPPASDAENHDPSDTLQSDATQIRNAVRRSSSVRNSNVSKAHRRRSPTAATISSDASTGDMFAAGHVRRMVMGPPGKTDNWKASILSPRTEGVSGHHRGMSSSSRRTTMSGPEGPFGHARSRSVQDRTAVRLSSANHSNIREKENTAGGVRASLVPGKSAWR